MAAPDFASSPTPKRGGSLSSFASQSHQFVQVETPPLQSRSSLASKLAGAPPPFTLTWDRVTLTVKAKNPESKRVEEKLILDNVNGVAHPGQLLVIMGPSGAGKSSLLDCISGRKDTKGGLGGSIAINGRPWSKSLKQLTSYVVQDDLFYETITVREHLVFQAQLRMGRRASTQECEKRVDEVMEQLGLVKCRDTLIGGSSRRGISGGERKRLSFASEILSNPSLLFVDEPTSGLDSFMAETVVRQLQQIARDDGLTVVVTIHQPSSELFVLFDQLYLLSDGACVYDGPAAESVAYFTSLGYDCPAYVSPADYFMRQLVVVDKATDPTGVARVERLKSEWAMRRQSKSSLARRADANEIHVDEESHHLEGIQLGVAAQLRIILRRNVLSLVRDNVRFHAEIWQALAISVIIGLVYLQIDVTQSGVQNFTGAFFFFVSNEVFGAAELQFASLPLEVGMVRREYEAGLFHLASWYVARNLSDLPSQVLVSVVVFLPAYFMMGIGHGFSVFIYLQIMVVLVRSASVAMAYNIGCLCRRTDVATIVGMLILMPMMLFGGLLMNSSDTPVYFVWINYISPMKFGFDAMMKVFWDAVPSIPCNNEVENCVALSGAEVLENYGISDRSVLSSVLLLLVLNVGYRLLAFVALWFNVHGRK